MADAERGQPGTWEHLAQWRNGSIDLAATLATLPAADRDAAVLMDTMWPDQLHYVPGTTGRPGRWHIWDGRCQAPDESGLSRRFVDLFTRYLDKLFDECKRHLAAVISAQMTGQAQPAIDAAIEAAWAPWLASPQYKYAHGLRGPKAEALHSRLGTLRGVSPATFHDHHPDLLNAANCVIKLLPGPGEQDWMPHNPKLMMTYVVQANYTGLPADGSAPLDGCPEYAQLLWRATGGDQDVFWYLIKLLGYSLLGSNPFHLVFFLSGPTASGKSALLEILSTVLGPALAYDAQPALIGTDKFRRHARHEASMTGKRLITIAETNDRLFIDEMQLKRLTGQRTVSTERLYAPDMDTVPVTWAIIVANNDMPSVAHLDGALNRRIWVCPMGPTIPPEERDRTKIERVADQERDGILALMVWGCRQAMAVDSIDSPPDAVRRKTTEWQATQDTVALWLSEATIYTNGQSAAIEGRHCLASYRRWCEAQQPKLPALGRNNFYDSLDGQPGVIRTGDANHVWFNGFLLRETPMD